MTKIENKIKEALDICKNDLIKPENKPTHKKALLVKKFIVELWNLLGYNVCASGFRDKF